MEPYLWHVSDMGTWTRRASKVFNCDPLTIKSIVEYSWAKKYFLDVTCMKKGNQLITAFYVKPTDTNQYFRASSCQVSH